MTNNTFESTTTSVGRLVEVYLAVVAATLAALVLLSAVRPGLATQEAWGHGIVTAVLGGVLALRARAARAGRRGALRAVGVIAAVLLVANLVEALLPGVFPVWMRFEMVGLAALMAALVASVRRAGGFR